MMGRARRYLARLHRLAVSPPSRRREEGAVYPIVVVAVIIVFMTAAMLFYVGRAGDLRTRAQTAADSAALGAAAEIRNRALDFLVQGSLPYAGFSQESTPTAAKEYAKRNNASVTDVDYGDFYARTVKVEVRGDDPVDPGQRPRFAPDIARGYATAEAIATVDFPLNCSIVIGPGTTSFIILGVQCGATFVPKGSNPQQWIDLFNLRLVDKLPPKCGLGDVAGSGETSRPVLDITPSSGFGPRNGESHNGTDFPGGGEGSPIFAFADGVVVRAGEASGFGQWIVIDHVLGGQKVSTVYGHMWPDGVLVKPGQQVKAGQLIGKVGNNGHSTGPHLHFEYWQGGRFDGGAPIDPYPYVQAAPPPSGSQKAVNPAAIGGVSFACGPMGPGGPVNGNPGDAKLCAQAAKAAGFSGEDLVTITAIGMAESGCRPNAQNGNTNGSVDYGLFQINTIHGWPTDCLLDPSCNAQRAFELYSRRGGSFLDWCTYEAPACGGNGNGTYRQHLGTAREAVNQLG